MDFHTRTPYYSTPQSFHQSSENTACSQSPLALLEAKSPHFLRGLGHHESNPSYFPHHSCSNLVQSSHKVYNSPTYGLGSPRLGKQDQRLTAKFLRHCRFNCLPLHGQKLP